jgi:capsular exopolysaccharide synthesis family protein
MEEQTNQSLEHLFGTIWRRAPWIVLCTALAAAAAYGYSKHQTKKYTATAVLVFKSNQLSQQIAGLPGAGVNESQQSTNIRLIQLGDVAAKTAQRLDHGLTPGEVSAALSVSAQGESNIVNLSATATKPALAAALANTYAQQFEAEQQTGDHAYYVGALKAVDKQLAVLPAKERAGPVGVALEGRAQSLGVLAELRNPSVQVAQAASVPGSPSSPRVSRNTLLGALLGFLLGLGVAFLLERLDWRIREPKDLQAIYGAPLLGVVPHSAALSRAAGRRRSPRRKEDAKRALPPREEEVFQLIRAHLRYFNIDRELRTLLVVSAAPGDGKTTIARHLASAAARMGSVVLLLEADLRSPALAEQLSLRPGPGLSDVLIGEQSLWSATQLVDVDSATVDGSSGRSLDVLAAGVPLPPNPAKLIESHAMGGVLAEARSTYDLVVIDTPPLGAVSDAFPLLREVDGVIIVGRGGRNRRDVAERLHETLTGAHAPLLGVVANGFKLRRLRSYDYAHDLAHTAAGWTPTRGVSVKRGPSSDEPLSMEEAPSPASNEAGRSRDGGSADEAAEPNAV